MELTEDRPKCLVEFRGRMLLQWQLDALRQSGIAEIAVVHGYRGAQLAPFGLRMFENARWAETQMVTSLAAAADWLRSDTCVVSYSDIFYTAGAVEALVSGRGDRTIAYDPDWLNVWQRRFANPLDDAETFRIDSEGRILEIGGKPATIDEVQGQYVGLLKFTPAGWATVEELRERLPDERDRMDMTRMLQHLIGSGLEVFGTPIGSEWGEIDSADDLNSLR